MTLMSAGIVDALGLVAGGHDVGGVDDAGVGLTGGHLGDDALDVLPRATAGVTVTPAAVKHLLGVLADRHLGCAGDERDAGLGQVGDARDALRVARADDDLQLVGGEDHRLAGVAAGVGELRHVGLVGRGEHVGRRALLICVTSADEAAKLNVTLASGLAALNAVPISLKAVGERRGGEHRDRAGHRCRRAVVVADELVESEPQPASRPSAASRATSARPPGSARGGGEASGSGGVVVCAMAGTVVNK